MPKTVKEETKKAQSTTASAKKKTVRAKTVTTPKESVTKATKKASASATTAKSAAKAPVAKKATAKKPTAKKPITKKATAKKPVTKKTATKAEAPKSATVKKKNAKAKEQPVNKTATKNESNQSTQSAPTIDEMVEQFLADVDLSAVTADTALKFKRGRPSAAEAEARKKAQEILEDAKKKLGVDAESMKNAQSKKKIQGPGAKATTFKKRELEGEEAERAKELAAAAENKKRSQTKEEQQKKKEEFNKFRVEWFDGYMKGTDPTLYDLKISEDPEVLLDNNEQLALAQLIQSGVAATIMESVINESKGGDGSVRKTIENDRDAVATLLAEYGYTPEYFKKNVKARRRMAKLLAESDKGREIFALKNIKFVKLVAGRRKRTSAAAANVDFDDLLAEGMTGLMTAIDHFNPALGFTFSTPAAWWIDQPIRNYLDSKTKTIHMPTHMNNIYKSIHYALRELREQYANDEDITDEMIADYIQSTGRDITAEKIKEARMLRRETISYDVPVGDNGSNNKTLIEMIESDDNHEEDIVSRLSRKDMFNRMLSLIDDDKKREVIRDWYSTDEEQDIIILSNVSRKHCLTKERVRQLKSEGENELREKVMQISQQIGASAEDIFVGNYTDPRSETMELMGASGLLNAGIF